MSGFTKLHSSLTASSIWNEPNTIRIVWVTMLSMADGDGNVKGSVIGLAHLARIPLPETEKALAVLSAPDPHSGRKELEGRRITPIDGGWHLVTHEFYREMGMSEETKRYWRDKKRTQRMSKNVPDNPRKSRSLGDGTASVHASVSEEGESEGITPELIYDAYPKKVGRPVALRSISKAMSKFDPALLLDKTKAFSAARNGDLEFVPNPATWFNQERFNDDPSTWKRSNGQFPPAGGKPKKELRIV